MFWGVVELVGDFDLWGLEGLGLFYWVVVMLGCGGRFGVFVGFSEIGG